MSILVAKLKTQENTSLLKKTIDALLEIAEALTYEEYRDSAFANLLEEGKKSKELSDTQARA